MALNNDQVRVGLVAGPIRIAAAGAALLLLCSAGAARRPPGGVEDGILGIRINSDFQSAERKLNALGSREPGAEQEESEPGHTLAWRLKRTDFQRIAIRTNADGKILWLAGVARRARPLSSRCCRCQYTDRKCN